MDKKMSVQKLGAIKVKSLENICYLTLSDYCYEIIRNWKSTQEVYQKIALGTQHYLMIFSAKIKSIYIDQIFQFKLFMPRSNDNTERTYIFIQKHKFFNQICNKKQAFLMIFSVIYILKLFLINILNLHNLWLTFNLRQQFLQNQYIQKIYNISFATIQLSVNKNQKMLQRYQYKAQLNKISKVSSSKGFRIRSAPKFSYQFCSAQKDCTKKITSQTKVQLNQLGKRRSGSHRQLKISRRLFSKARTSNNESDQQAQAQKKSKNYQSIKTDCNQEIQNEQIKLKLKQRARIFNPKIIMKLGRKKTQNTQVQTRKQSQPEVRNSQNKCQFRLNRYVLDEKVKKDENNLQISQYWKRVNESLILPPSKNENQEQLSKDLQQICMNFVTQ